MRVGIVNDMVMIVELLKRIVISVPGNEVAWVAYDGAEAVKRCAADRPDLILMDLIMPNMGGVEATYHIMQQTPCAILIVTASVLGNIGKVFEAMGHGALDVVRTPALRDGPQSAGAEELLKKMELINRIVRTSTLSPKPVLPPKEERSEKNELPLLISLGASTGGPLALSQILSHLPPDFSAAVVIIQHVDTAFSHSFVRWLGDRCAIPVAIAKPGDVPTRGTVLVAGTDEHLILTEDHHFDYVMKPTESIYRPSVDVFFQSVQQHWPNKGVAAVLTGMGKDGAHGLLGLAEKGWVTIAQQEQSCVVYGMPRAAIELHAAHEVLPLKDIGPRLVASVTERAGECHGRC